MYTINPVLNLPFERVENHFLKGLFLFIWIFANYKIKPTEVSIGSHKKVIWRCKKGHEWEAAVKSRTINKTGCPYCSHNKVLAGFNDLIIRKMR